MKNSEKIIKVWYSIREVSNLTGIKSWKVRYLARMNPKKVRVSMAGHYKFHYKFVETLKDINL